MTDAPGIVDSDRRQWLPWLIIVLALSAALRIWVALTTVTRIYPDSTGYLRLAHQIGRLDLSADNGARTPLYPFVLLALHYSPDVTRAFQMVLGLVITAAIFWMVLRLTGRTWAAVLGSSIYGLNLTQIKYESGLLTESTTTFLLVILAITLTWLWVERGRHLAAKVTVIGLCAGLLPLDRPTYVFVPFLAVAVTLLWAPSLFKRWALVGVLVATAFIPMLAWSTYNFERFDTFGLSTMSGFDLTNKTGDYIKDAPNRYATIRDMYVAALAARGGNPRDLIWSVIPHMMAVTGESYPELSKTMLKMNEGLILHHQKQYWANVASVFADFWKIDTFEESLPALGGMTHGVWRLFELFGRLMNLAFLLISAFWVVRAVTRRRWPQITPVVWMAAVAIISGAVCALVIDGSNSRFGMPTQPYVTCVVLAAVCSYARSRSLVRRTSVARPAQAD